MWRVVRFSKSQNLSKIFRRFESTTTEEKAKPVHEVVQQQQPITYHQVKGALLKRTLFVKVSSVLSIFGGVAVIMNYVYDWENTPERQLTKALNHLSYNDLTYKHEGFKLLNHGLFVTKRVFSGPVGIPVGVDALAKENVISSLVNSVQAPEVVSLDALAWIYRLVTYYPLAKEVHSLVLHSDPSLQKISSNLVQEDYNTSYAWILASHIILNLSHKGKFSNNGLERGIEAMVSSGNPLAMATAIRLSRLLPKDADINNETKQYLKKTNVPATVSLNSTLVNIGLDFVPQYNLHSLNKAHGPSATIASTIFFGVFAMVWGKVMWSISTSMSPSYKALLAKEQDPEHIKNLRKNFLKNRRVGLGVFSLLLFDYLSSKLMHYCSGEKIAFNSGSPVPLPKGLEKNNLPLSSFYPMFQSSLFLLGTLLLIQTQRFVVVPLLLAGSFYNRDLLRKIYR